MLANITSGVKDEAEEKLEVLINATAAAKGEVLDKVKEETAKPGKNLIDELVGARAEIKAQRAAGKARRPRGWPSGEAGEA